MSAFHTLTVAEVRREANDGLYVRFDVPDASAERFRFIPGQYLTLVAHIDGEEVRRSYSICSAAGEDLAVGIKRIEGGRFSEHAHAEFAVGQTVQALEPAGSFCSTLHKDQARRYLLIAAGSGITPILSIAKSVLATEPDSFVTLLYGNRRAADVMFREALLWLKNRHMARFQWINLFSRERQEAPLLNGRIDNDKGAQLDGLLLDIGSYDEYFLCGPEAMISEVSRGLRNSGVDPAQIHYERFFASAADAQEAAARHTARAERYGGLMTTVAVRHSGREVHFALTADGENILDGAIANGLELPFSCKGGVCATCKARVLEGQVDMDLNHALSEQEVASGFVLTCQAHPISDSVVVDFDVI